MADELETETTEAARPIQVGDIVDYDGRPGLVLAVTTLEDGSRRFEVALWGDVRHALTEEEIEAR